MNALAVLTRAFVVLALAACFLSSLTASAQDVKPGEQYGEPIGPQAEAPVPGTGVPGDDDPRVYPEEVVAPSMDSTDPAWQPVYEKAEDPASIECGGREACEDYKAEEASKSDSRTSTGATR